MTALSAWNEFWNRPNTGIYVNQRNLEAHFESLAKDLAPLMPAEGAVLDYGCGDALAAGVLASRCASLTLYDAADAVRARVRARYSNTPRITVADSDDSHALPPASFDMVIVVSVAQYVPYDAFPELLRRWRGLLAPGGRLILADVVPPDTPLARDIASQLSFALRNGFFVAALLGVVKLALSDYRQVRKSAGFSTYSSEAMTRLLTDAGFSAERMARNIGPTPHRMTFMAAAVA